MMSDFLWCAMRDLNPHGRPLDPKSSASANSANRAHVAKGLCLCGKPFTVSIKKRNLRSLLYTNGDSTGNRTPVTAVKGRCLDRLTMEPHKFANRQRPAFPGSLPPSIIGARELNCCVRDGNRCILSAIVTGLHLLN